MTKSELQLIDEKFKGVISLMNAQFINVHEKLERIEEQTTRTNGRVTSLEKDFLTHPINCSKGKDIEAIKTDLEEYRMIKKYPKIMITLLVVFVIATIFSLYKTVQVPRETKSVIQQEMRNQEGISKVTRGGYVKYNDQGISDSVKIHNWK